MRAFYAEEQKRHDPKAFLSSGAPMPPEFEEAAKQAFMPLTFRPGILNGIPVKSRIRIEVVFDNTPLPDATVKPQDSSNRP